MQPLMKSESPQFAIRLRDYIRFKYGEELVLKQEVDQDGKAFLMVYVSSSSPYLAQIEQETKHFVENYLDPVYQQTSWQAGDLTDNTLSQRLIAYFRKGGFKQGNFSTWLMPNAFFTTLITVLCIVIYLAQNLGWQEQIFELAHYPFDELEQHQYWRYVSHSLVHLSIFHISFNLVWWWIFGGAIERKLGSVSLIGLFLCSAMLTGICQNWLSGPLFFGLSGVVYAVLGLTLVLEKLSSTPIFNLPEGFLSMIIIGLAMGFVYPLAGINIGNGAHISGFVVGVGYALMIYQLKFAKTGG